MSTAETVGYITTKSGRQQAIVKASLRNSNRM
jgi:hypothetical protein